MRPIDVVRVANRVKRVIEVDHLTKRYGTKVGVDDPSFVVPRASSRAFWARTGWQVDNDAADARA